MGHNEILVNLSSILILGIGAQWIAWRIKLPSILLLLVFGILAGPITHIVDTDHLFGELLFPIVSLSVAVILFEGGLSLRWEDVRETRRTVRNLITIGALITWLITTVASYFILNLDLALSLLLGATLIVTGPTVVIPLLQQVRPSPRIGNILRWEGIIIDPVGAVIAVLVFEEILAGNSHHSMSQAVFNLVKTVLIGMSIGVFSGRLLITMFSHHWIPDRLHNSVTLMLVIGAFTLSNVFQAEAGLLTVTIMGMVMVNQKQVALEHIIEFKENLQVLLISSLFILLAAKLKTEELQALGVLRPILFIMVLVLITRPISVWVSTYKSNLTWQEKLFTAWMAPRGIVAASVASIFSLELINRGHAGAETLVPITFMVIISSVAIYGLTAARLAKYLGLVQENPQGVLIVGAHAWVRKIALEIKKAGFSVLLLDTNSANVEQAKDEGLTAIHADAIDFYEHETSFGLGDIGYLLAMTPNNAVNTLATEHYKNILSGVYRLPQRTSEAMSPMNNRIDETHLFGEGITFDRLTIHFNRGAEVKTIKIADVDAFYEKCRDCVIPLFVIKGDGQLLVWTALSPPILQNGEVVIVMINSDDEINTVINETQEFILAESLQHLVKPGEMFVDN